MTEPLDPIQLAARLMEIDSTSGREGPVVDWLHAFLVEREWRVTRIPVSGGRDDLFATACDEPLVTLSTHLDTVPPYIAPSLAGDVLRGRGACDAKGIAASMMCAADLLRDDGVPVSLLFVVGEEVTHDGAHAANRVRNASRVIIDGEPTGSTLAVGSKGAIRTTVRTTGKAAHSAYPHLGHSATLDLARLLVELDDLDLPRDELLGDTTINIGVISGGVADNVTAPMAEARLMTRLVTPVETVRPLFERWADGRAILEWGPMVPPVKLGVLPGYPTSVAAFATDIPELTNWGTPYLFGPGSIHDAHTDAERVSVDELRSAVPSYQRIATEALRRA